MLVKEGQVIRKGEVLARLNPRDFISAQDSALAQYEAVKSVADRLEKLYESRAVSRQALDLAQRDVRTAAASLERAEKALEETELIADFDGKVARLLVDDFANVAAKQEVMIIQDDSLLEIAFSVPESMITIPDPDETREEMVAKAKPVVILSAVPDRSFPARFSEASETPDPATRTYEVKLVFDPPDDVRVQPGMTAKVRAWLPPNEQNRTQGYPVPTNAVVSDHAGVPHLWRVDPETMTVSRIAVSTGALAEDRIIVTGEVETGDLIVVSGVHYLSEGQTVRIWE
jgi:RND family efflux transporter MFP subunit